MRATRTLFQRAWYTLVTSWYTLATCHVDLISDAREPIAARRERVSACHVERRCIRCQRFAIIHRVKGPRQHRRSALLGQIHHTRLYRSHSPRAVSSRGKVPSQRSGPYSRHMHGGPHTHSQPRNGSPGTTTRIPHPHVGRRVVHVFPRPAHTTSGGKTLAEHHRGTASDSRRRLCVYARERFLTFYRVARGPRFGG